MRTALILSLALAVVGCGRLPTAQWVPDPTGVYLMNEYGEMVYDDTRGY